MKKLAALFILPLLMVQTPLSASPLVQETPYELSVAADLDGDGHADVVIADKERGTMRVAFGTPDGHEARPAVSILPGISTIAVARLAGPAANRIVVGSEKSGGLRVLAVDKTNAAGFVTVDPPLEVEGIGPGRIAALSLGWPGGTAGRDDLVVATSENGMPSVGKWETLLTGAGGPVSSGPVYSLEGAVLAGSNRVLWLVPMGTKQSTPGDLLLGAVVGSESSTRNLMIFDPSAGDLNPKTPEISVNMNSLNTNQRHMRAVSGFFGPSQQSRVLLFGYNEQMVHSRAYWSGNMVIGLPEFRNFSERVATITVVPGEEGISDRLLVTFVSGPDQAALYDYDGVSFPVKVTGFAAPAGGNFAGGLALPDGGFLLLERESQSNRTSGIARYDRDGNFLGRSTIGEAPLLSGRGNVLFLDGTPLADASARVVSTVAVDDWSTTVEGFGAPLKIRGETFRGAAAGLGDAANTILPSVPAGALGVVANQFAQDMSVYNFGGAAGAVQDSVEIDPPAGSYPGAVTLGFRSAANDRARANGQPEPREIFYRIDTNLSTGAWQAHDPENPPRIAASSTVRFYSAAKTGGAQGVIKTALYNLPSGAIDSDGDGIPDSVEVAKGLDPEAGVDSDGDGYSDLTELYFGTDPNDGASNPGRLADGSRVPGLDGLTGAFDLVVHLRGRISSKDAYPITGTPVTAQTLDGGAMATGNALTVGAVSMARLPGVRWEPDPFLTLRTPPNFNLSNGMGTGGREMGAVVLFPDAPASLAGGNTEPISYVADLREAYRPKSGTMALMRGGVSSALGSNVTAAGLKAALDAMNGGAGLFGSGNSTVTGAMPRFTVRASAPAGRSTANVTVSASYSTPASLVHLVPRMDTLNGGSFVEFDLLVSPAPATATANVTVAETLAALLVEAKLGSMLGIENPTVFPARPADAGRTPFTREALAALEAPFDGETPKAAYSVADVVAEVREAVFANSPAPGVADLLSVVEYFYEFASSVTVPPTPDAEVIKDFASGNLTEIPASMPMPIDAIRQFLADGTIGALYVNEPSAGQLNSARAAVANLLSAPAPRPTLLVDLTFGHGGRLGVPGEYGMMTEYELYDANGARYVFDSAIALGEGTRVRVLGFNDLVFEGGFSFATPLEVVSVSLLSLPEQLDDDSDNNLLADVWEEYFFGTKGNNPFATTKDGKSLVQLYLDGADPERGSDTAIADLFPRRLSLRPVSFVPRYWGSEPQAGWELGWKFPAAYSRHFRFKLEATNSLTDSFFQTMADSDQTRLGDDHAVNLLDYGAGRKFWRLKLELNRGFSMYY
jgi:hypothetical protein